MSAYVITRLLGMLPTMLVLVLLVVFLVRLVPANAIDIMLQEQVNAGETDRETLERKLGLAEPFMIQFARYSLNAARGDLGSSLWSGEPVRDIIFSRIGVTLELTILALVTATAVSIPIGIVSSVKQNSFIDYLLRSAAIFGLSVPNFALATIVIIFPTLYLGWSPPLTYHPLSDGMFAHVSQLLLPSAIIGLAYGATLMRYVRTMLLEVMRLDYIRTARAKGLSERVVLMRHALRNAMIPVVSVMGLQLALLLSGTVVIETVFGIPGLGRTLLDAVGTRDYPVVQGIALVSGALVMAVNLLVDISYGYLDPRNRH